MEADILHTVWYAKPNDLVGGWSVLNCDKPPSQADYRNGEWIVADFLGPVTAHHIAELHNIWLRADTSPHATD